MSTPIEELSAPKYPEKKNRTDDHSPTSDEGTYINEGSQGTPGNNHLAVDTSYADDVDRTDLRSPLAQREEAKRLQDDLALLEAEKVASRSIHEDTESKAERNSMSRSRSHRSQNVDEFDEATNPLHEKAAVYNPPESPNTSIARFVKKIHESSFIIRYLTYIVPLVLVLLIPLLVGALAYPDANVGGVQLLWFSVWLEIVWLTLWAGRIVAKCIPVAVGLLASIFTNNAKKWRDMAKQLELHGTFFFWWLGIEISFLPTMKNHHVDGNSGTRSWENTVNKIIISIFVWTILNYIEKIIIQLIAISFHTRTYADRIEINKFQIGSLTKLYDFSRNKISVKDDEFEEKVDTSGSGTKTPLRYAGKAQRVAKGALNKVGDMAGAVAADFTGRKATNSTHPYQVILTLLRTTSGSQVLARRLYRTFVRDGFDTVFAGDLKEAFDNSEEAEAAFIMFDKDMNGDISMDELEAVCVEIGRERKAITASLKDLDSVVSRLDNVLEFFVVVISLIVFVSLISTSASGVLTSAGSSILALSWLFSATAQEFLQSIIFVFVKHPFDVGDRVTIYGNAGDAGLGDDYFVKQISLLYTEFKKMQGHIVQAPNSYLNGLFILNQRRSGALAEAVPIVIKYGTTLEQIDALRQRLLEFVRSEKREFQTNILTEMRAVTENFSVTLNVVFFYKSNWQNEGLRLQRRNKFICMLMVALQEIGIEGPRMNLQGAGVDIPFHIQGFPPQMASADHDSRPPPTPIHDMPENTGLSSSSATRHPSILRKGMNTAAARARGESVHSHKHVDFSLGMRDLSSGDVMGDVFETTSPRVDDVVRFSNREAAHRRILEEEEEEEAERQSRSSSSRARRPSNLSVPTQSGEGRRSTDSHGTHSLSSISRNRFFRHRSSVSRERDDLAEQGRFDASDARSLSPGAR
ncbi:Mechanosensitive ion channel-domain-containing protein [Aspergillus pseudonomiae]|uniref:Mechanosensitive ion channel protein n=1 Tax=Aspergillus pseudonomiae TaxID=1506151 RepID=A0A5N6IEZ1_9EURO|nr:Mechanosensitive ion channel-domain-containing protein [Aspergillus pseudonomiae]KAB8265331.1 Mechanosensitive ion channel-domain-containing protein [Aspergillus pseudonomiae]KAE8402465.1 Mechanosensitive ion channel-domain-containing protein [Aspergillus pseudonomiae]